MYIEQHRKHHSWVETSIGRSESRGPAFSSQPECIFPFSLTHLTQPLLFLALLWLSAAALQAATLTVTNASEEELRDAIAHAAPGDTVFLDLEDEPIYLSTELVIDKDLNLVGRNRTNTVISGSYFTRVLHILAGNVFLTQLTITEANSAEQHPPYGGAILNNGTLRLNDCSLLFNFNVTDLGTNSLGATNLGGAIYSCGLLSVENSLFMGNSCSWDGGAIYNSGTATLVASTFIRNTAQGRGGAIENRGALLLRDCGVLTNLAVSGGGGGLANAINATATLAGCKFICNTNESYGGGAIINRGSIVLTNSVLAGNAVKRDAADPVLGGGGALHNSGTASIFSSTVGPGNWARRGGGILNVGGPPHGTAQLWLISSTIYSNMASMFGGGVMNAANGAAALANATNCTISGNSVEFISSTGGGLDNSSLIGSAVVNLRNCTIIQNLVASSGDTNILSGAGIFSGKFGSQPSDQAIINLGNTILSGNIGTPFQGRTPSSGGQLISLGYNQCSDPFTPLTPTNGVLRVPNSFGPPMANGAVIVYPLYPNAPAIDGGDPVNSPAIDQRGLPRPFGAGFDVGAVEQTLRFTTNVVFAGFGRTNVQVFFSPYLRTNYVLETTTDLRNWTIVRSNIPVSSLLPWTDVPVQHAGGALGSRQRFYRVRMQQ